jgi:hypothetical protein
MHSITRRLAGALATGAALAAASLAAVPAAHAASPVKPAGALPMSVYTGNVAPGDTRGYVFNNAATDRVFTVGLDPTGATTTANCLFEVTRKWDVKQPGGEREFHFTVKNVGSIACGTTVQVASVEYTHQKSLGAVDIGGTVTWGFNTSNEDLTYLGGVNPVGATASTPCQFQVTAKNVGDIACSAVGMIGDIDEDSEQSLGIIQPGDTTDFSWANTSADWQYVPGVNALLPASADCKYQVTRVWYGQRIRSDGIASRDLHLTVKNVGTVTCLGVFVQLAAIDTAA